MALRRSLNVMKAVVTTIAEKFNTYPFADYKEQVIDLLKRVTTVSVGTMEVVRGMEGTSR